MPHFNFNTQPAQHYTTTNDISNVNRDDRPTTPDEFSPFNLASLPSQQFYYIDPRNPDDNPHSDNDDPLNTPLDSPLPTLLFGILIVYIYKASKKIPSILAHLKKKH